jgi:RNA polymerase sigma-70 factor (ECF subfamily)
MDRLREQFSQIYDEYIEKIYRFVYLKVNSQEMAEDITSKVFMKGWESYQKKGQNIKNPSAFLYQIARNSVIDHYREKARKNTISSEILPEISDNQEDAQSKAILSADVNIVREAIKKLEKEHQDIIIWHYLEDMPVEQIAQLLGRPEGTIRVMMHRGIKELKGLIKEG